MNDQEWKRAIKYHKHMHDETRAERDAWREIAKHGRGEDITGIVTRIVDKTVYIGLDGLNVNRKEEVYEAIRDGMWRWIGYEIVIQTRQEFSDKFLEDAKEA